MLTPTYVRLLASLIFLILTIPSFAIAQSRVQGYVELGGFQYSGTSTARVQRSFPAATVTVYQAGTTNLATVYSNAALSPRTNPFLADTNGYWFFYAANGKYDVQFTHTSLSSPITLSDVVAYDLAGTNISLTAPAEFVVSGSPVIDTGTISITKANQNQNTVYAAPSSGTGPPSFRQLVTSDIPPMAGDVTGNIGANTVTKLQNRAVSNSAPGYGQALVWNGTAWTPFTWGMKTFDVNSPTYGLVADTSTADSTTGLQNAFNDACTWSNTNNKPTDVEFDWGQYWIKGPLQQTGGYNTQVKWPLSASNNPCSVKLRPKGDGSGGGFIQTFWEVGTPSAKVMLISTLTAQSYSTAGWPSMIGAPDPRHGENPSSHISFAAFHSQGISYKVPANPSIAILDMRNTMAAVIEDTVAFSEPSGSFPATFTEPTNQTGVAFLMPINNRDLAEYRGYIWILGMYGALGVSELTNSNGQIHLVHNKVALHFQTWYQNGSLAGWAHGGHFPYILAVRQDYVGAAIDPTSGTGGVIPMDSLAPAVYRNSFKIDRLQIEDAVSGWATPICHFYDLKSRMTGEVAHHRVLEGFGPISGINDQPGCEHGSRHIKFTDLVSPNYSPNIVYDRMFGTGGKSLTTRWPSTHQGSGWVTPAVSGTETYVPFTFQVGGNVLGTAAAHNMNFNESRVSDVIVSAIARFTVLDPPISASIPFRATDFNGNQFWRFRWLATGDCVIEKKTAANMYTPVITGSVGIPVAQRPYTMVVYAKGDKIRAYANGIQCGSEITDSTYQNNTIHGIYSFGAGVLISEYLVTQN